MSQAKIRPDTAGQPPSLPRQQSSISKITPFLKLSQLALYMGAGFSIMDLIFDIAMVYTFSTTGHPKFAAATLATICLSIFFQLILVVLQNAKRDKRVLLREVLFVVTFVKPGVDVYRVVTKQEQAKNAMFPPMSEMVYLKAMELVSECIPGAVIQTMGFVNGGHSLLAIMSLISSILTAAFIGASMTIEKDVDKVTRKSLSQDFYGLVDLKSRRQATAVCVLVLLISACQLASKSFAVTLCYVESGAIVAAYLGIDIGVAFIYKMARGNFRYWLPIESEAVSWIVSLLVRLCTKILMDFTGLLLWRHPVEYGGVYFTFVLLTTPLVSLYFGSRYLSFVEDEEVKATLDHVFSSDQIYGGLGCLAAVQLFSFAILMSIIPPKIRKTFLSAKTASQFTCENFESATNSSAKMDVFLVHPSYSSPIEEELKAWLNERLVELLEEKPDWFNTLFIASVDDDIMPARVLARLKEEAEGGVRRRSSLMERLSVRIADPEKVDKESDSDSSGEEEEED